VRSNPEAYLDEHVFTKHHFRFKRSNSIFLVILTNVGLIGMLTSQCETRARPLRLSSDGETSLTARKSTKTSVQIPRALLLIQISELFNFYRGGWPSALTYFNHLTMEIGYSRRSHRRAGPRKEPRHWRGVLPDATNLTQHG
jgi:hypothetical protein